MRIVKDIKELTEGPFMEHYKTLYKDSKMWNGESLYGKRIVVYGQQGYGDVIHMARYLKPLSINSHVMLHCPMALCSLLSQCAEVFPREEDHIPDHDFHVLSLTLPLIVRPDPGGAAFLRADPLDIDVSGPKIGIAWEGNPHHPNNMDRSCPLKHFECLKGNIFMLQMQVNVPELSDGSNVELLGVEMGDFLRTAQLIQAMDYVVCVDTSVLHLAGALGKRAYGLLAYDHDRRWLARWYDSVTIVKQDSPGDWEGVFRKLLPILP